MKDIIIPEITKMSSKGQIVIPRDIRERLHIKENTIFSVVAEKDIIVLKKVDTKLKADDLKTLKLIEEAWEDIEKGKSKTYSKEEFLEEMKKW